MANGRNTGGRTAGTPNRLTANVKAMILGALDDAGGQRYLAEMAHANSSAFLALVGKILPTQMTGDDGGAIEMIVTGVRRAHEIEPGEFEAEPP
jgi:hypothetical protein